LLTDGKIEFVDQRIKLCYAQSETSRSPATISITRDMRRPK